MDDTAPESANRTVAADRRDGLLAVLLSQLTLLSFVVVTAADPYGVLALLSFASVVLVGLPAFVGGLVLLAPRSA